MKIEIIESFDGALQREVWLFEVIADWTHQITLYFDEYRVEERQSIRHIKWFALQKWVRLDARNSTISKPSVPESILIKVKAEICKAVNELKEGKV